MSTKKNLYYKEFKIFLNFDFFFYHGFMWVKQRKEEPKKLLASSLSHFLFSLSRNPNSSYYCCVRLTLNILIALHKIIRVSSSSSHSLKSQLPPGQSTQLLQLVRTLAPSRLLGHSTIDSRISAKSRCGFTFSLR